MFPPMVENEERPAKVSPAALVAAVAVLIAAGLVWYSRTAAFAWDEGYHLVAAWLIAHGKQPYIDFVFPQTPFNAYWNSILLRVIGEDWRVPHTAAALLTSGAVAMMATYVYRRLPESSWRAPAAVSAAVIMGLNTAVVEFGSLQAYGMCLFMIVAAYLCTVNSVDRPGILLPAFAGLSSGAAAASSLLSAPVAPILLIWMLVVNRTAGGVKKLLGFCAGVTIAFIPLLRLLIKSPHHVIFGFLQYQLLYRKVDWDEAGSHNLGEVLSWGDSSQAVLLVLLAIAGIVYIRKSDAPRAIKSELYLCACLALVVGAYLLTARPTFTRYYLLTIIAATGLREVTVRLATRPSPWLAAAMLCALTSYGLAASLFEQRDDLMWHDVEQAAAKVREVTPPTASLLADEVIYFDLHRMPPTGMELEDSHKLRFSDAEAMALHVVPRPKLDIMIKAGRFDTVEMCDDDEIERLDLASLYSKTATVGTCKVFWNRAAPTPPPAAEPQ